MGLSHTVSEIDGDFSRKLRTFLTPCTRILRPRSRGSPWNWISALGVKKTRIMGLPGREKKLDDIFSRDGQTDTGMVWYGIVEFNVPLDTV